MRRQEIIDAADNVLRAITQSGIKPVIDTLRGAEARGSGGSKILQIFSEFQRFSRYFERPELQLIQILSLDFLLQHDWWGDLAEGDPEKLRRAFGAAWRPLRFATEDLPKIVRLLEPEHIGASDPTSEGTKARTILSVILIEEEKMTSPPERLVLALQSISELHGAVCKLAGISATDLHVVGCDSGSDKSFDFLGAAKAMEGLRSLILDGWDKVVFYREKKIVEKGKAIASSLAIVEEINEKEKAGKISPEQAEILRREVISGFSKFLDAGATIPELEGRKTIEPRLLMAPSPKLIANLSENKAPANQAKDQAVQGRKKLPPKQKLSSDEGAKTRLSPREIAKFKAYLESVEKDDKDDKDDTI